MFLIGRKIITLTLLQDAIKELQDTIAIVEENRAMNPSSSDPPIADSHIAKTDRRNPWNRRVVKDHFRTFGALCPTGQTEQKTELTRRDFFAGDRIKSRTAWMNGLGKRGMLAANGPLSAGQRESVANISQMLIRMTPSSARK
ncbi:unnamed protein product [Protopolystoma xenopodis]|uniref:Uncharacterized protein n=1 Tax=Protopolystoma xenopodis TaxID=117903 RepID=A0A3S5A970_9PLAT|nr:unnamed protein product [Protopolystoma xenopodis]